MSRGRFTTSDQMQASLRGISSRQVRGEASAVPSIRGLLLHRWRYERDVIDMLGRDADDFQRTGKRHIRIARDIHVLRPPRCIDCIQALPQLVPLLSLPVKRQAALWQHVQNSVPHVATRPQSSDSNKQAIRRLGPTSHEPECQEEQSGTHGFILSPEQQKNGAVSCNGKKTGIAVNWPRAARNRPPSRGANEIGAASGVQAAVCYDCRHVAFSFGRNPNGRHCAGAVIVRAGSASAIGAGPRTAGPARRGANARYSSSRDCYGSSGAGSHRRARRPGWHSRPWPGCRRRDR